MFKKVLFPKNPPQLAPNKELCDEDNSNKTILLHCLFIKQDFLFYVNSDLSCLGGDGTFG